MNNLKAFFSSDLLPIFAILIIYTSIIYLIAFIASSNTNKISDFVLGDRNLSGFITAMSAGASDMSSWLLTAFPGLVYLNGFSTLWLPISLTIGAYLNWKLIAKRLRIYSEEANNSLTIPEFLNNRFNSKGKSLRLMTGIILIIFFIFYAVAGFRSAAKVTQMTFGFNYHISLLISGVFIVTYTTIGGFLAVSWIDVFQGLLMFFALLMVPLVAYNKIDNISLKINQIIIENPNYFNVFEGITILGIISLFAWGMGYVGQPHIIGRFMAIRSHTELPFARNICTIWMLIAMIGAFFVGIIGPIYYKSAPLLDPETVFLKLSKVFFNPWVNGILLCAVISSIMSTVSALILMSANALIEDFFEILNNKQNNKNKNNIWMHRLAIIIIAGISLWIASNPKISIMQSVAFPWCGLGASFGPVIIMSLYWKNITYKGAVSGVLSGGGFVILWELLSSNGNKFINYPDLLPGFCLLPAFVISTFFIMIISLKTKDKNTSMVEKFKIVKKKF